LLGSVHDVVSRSFAQWQTLSVEDVELAITLLYQLAEALPVSMASVSLLISNIIFMAAIEQMKYIQRRLQTSLFCSAYGRDLT